MFQGRITTHSIYLETILASERSLTRMSWAVMLQMTFKLETLYLKKLKKNVIMLKTYSR
jgi:hypothetical protein